MHTHKKKILYVITKGSWGGAQRYVFDLATHLPRDRFDIAVAMGDGARLEQKLTEAGIRTVRLLHLKETRRAGPQSSDVAAFFELVRLFRAERPDIIHVNSSRAAFLGVIALSCFQFLNFLTAKSYICKRGRNEKSAFHSGRAQQIYEAKSSYKLKAIFTAHGWPFKEPRSRFIRLLLWLASYVTAFLSHEIITLSEGDYGLGKAMPGVGKKMSLIYNGIEETEAFSKREAREKLFGAYDDSMWIGTIAELNQNKGIMTLIEAFARLPKSARLCIIGEGDDRKKLAEFAVSEGAVARIVFKGALLNASAYLPAFDIFALPSLKEGLPYSMLEAGIRGIPVVGSDISGIRDIVHDDSHGKLVPAQDAHALELALAYLIDHRETRVKLGLALKERITQTFSLRQMLAKTLAVYEF